MVRDLFVNQVTPWKGLATRHIQASIAAVKYFLDAAVADLTRIAVQDPIMQGNMARNDMEAAIQRELVAPFIADRSEDMMQKLENLLQSYRVRNPITYNHYFTENVQNLRKKRLQDRIQVQLCKHFGWPEGEFESYAKGGLGQIDLIKFVAGVSSENDADMDKFACTEIVDYMEAYFKARLPPLQVYSSANSENRLLKKCSSITSQSKSSKNSSLSTFLTSCLLHRFKRCLLT